MKIIYPTSVQSVSASTENANFPAVNLIDEHPKKLWKATGQTATVSISSLLSTGLALFKTNAISMSITVAYGQTITWDTADAISWDTADSISWDDSEVDDPPVVYELSGEDEGAGWSEWDELMGSHTIVISLDAGAGNIVQAGYVAVGTVEGFENPAYGINEGLVDYSVVKELNNGAFYIRKRDVVRTFSGSLSLSREPDFYGFMLDILRTNGQTPLAVMMVDDDSWEWIVYGRFTDAEGPHVFRNRSVINFNFLEVL